MKITKCSTFVTVYDQSVNIFAVWFKHTLEKLQCSRKSRFFKRVKSTLFKNLLFLEHCNLKICNFIYS